jgi:hypothetical protein
MRLLPRFLMLVLAVPILAITSAQAQTSYQLTGLCRNGLCLTFTPTQEIYIYLTPNDTPFMIKEYTAPTYELTATLDVKLDGTFEGGSLTDVNVVTVVHRQGRFETKTVTFTGTITFDAPQSAGPGMPSPIPPQPMCPEGGDPNCCDGHGCHDHGWAA